MKVENHDTTKLGNQHENLLKREIQRMWTNIKLCLTTYVHVYYNFLIQARSSLYANTQLRAHRRAEEKKNKE